MMAYMAGVGDIHPERPFRAPRSGSLEINIALVLHILKSII